ncbi:MAG TPA: uroporphyrinogen decarboxylase family protein [Opitutaceae bacterium]|nr:uroporphyrinogen decarboxylase family protein [Opitutaceae bacterium]
MTSRERILTALNHQEPDRVPVDLSGHRSSGIAAMAYARLRRHLGLPQRPIRVYDPVQQLAIVDEDVLQRFHVDAIELGRAFALEDKYWTDWVLPDGTPCLMPVWAKPERQNGDWVLRSAPSKRVIARMPEGVWYFEQANFPFLEHEDLGRLEAEFAECMWSGIASPPGPIVAGPDGAGRLAEGARQLRQQTDRAIIGLFGGNLLELGQWFYRNDNFFMLLAGEPERAHRFLDKLMEIHMRNLEEFLGAVASHIDIILFGDDLGMQSGPQVSPAMYREYFQPRERAMWQLVKQRAPHLKIMLHCCGGVRELLPGLIEAGLEAINPVQITCRGMDPAGLKRDFGARLTFWGGGCDTRDILIQGTPEQVSEHVRRQVSLLRPGGGFVFQQVHNILADVPPANVVAMYDAVMGA